MPKPPKQENNNDKLTVKVLTEIEIAGDRFLKSPKQDTINMVKSVAKDNSKNAAKILLKTIDKDKDKEEEEEEEEEEEGEEEEEKDKDSGSSSKSGSPSKSGRDKERANHFYEGRIGAAIGGALYKLGGFDVKHAVPMRKLIEVGSTLTNFVLSKDNAFPPGDFSDSAKRTVKLLIDDETICETDKSYYLSPEGRKDYEKRAARWKGISKKKIGTVANCRAGNQTETNTDGATDLDLTDRGYDDDDEEEKEKETEKEKDGNPIEKMLFILALHLLMTNDRNKGAFTKEEIEKESDKVRSYFPETQFADSRATLDQNIRDNLITVYKERYILTNEGAELGSEIFAKHLERVTDNEPPSKRSRPQESGDEPPKKRQKHTNKQPSPQPLQAPPSVSPPPPPPPQIPSSALISTKRSFQKVSMLVSGPLEENMGGCLKGILAMHKIGISTRISDFGWCLFWNGMANEYVINAIIVIPIENKKDKISESKKIEEILERTKKMGFRKVLVVGMTDKTKERCTEYKFRFKKVSSRGEIIDFIVAKAKELSRKLGKEFDAVPFNAIHFN